MLAKGCLSLFKDGVLVSLDRRDWHDRHDRQWNVCRRITEEVSSRKTLDVFLHCLIKRANISLWCGVNYLTRNITLNISV